MKNFKKLSSIAILLFTFAYPISSAQAKDSSPNNTLNPQSVEAENRLSGVKTGEILLAERRERRPLIIIKRRDWNRRDRRDWNRRDRRDWYRGDRRDWYRGDRDHRDWNRRDWNRRDRDHRDWNRGDRRDWYRQY